MIVIGLDGLEPSLAEPLMNAGELPNLAALRTRGGFARLATTSPAQTPVAWSTFATGVNPGGHGIFDFLRRDPKTYLPDLALNRYEQKNAFTPPRAVNSRKGSTIWDVLSAAGVPSTVLRCPCAYPADPMRGRLLAGMGVPDLRGGLGTSTFFTTAQGVAQRESELVVALRPSADGSFAAQLLGPRNPKDRSQPLTFDLTIVPDRDRRSVRIRSAGEPAELEIPLGRWSGWLRIKFKTGVFQSARGMVRFHFSRFEPDFELYASPVNFDPEAPLFPISSPPQYADELARDLGLYYTTGMIEDHAGLSNDRLSESAFLDQCAEVWDEREAMMVRELEQFREGFFYCLYDTPDRVQHMLWRHREPDHPANRGRSLSQASARALEDQYRRADSVVGTALEFADDETLLIAMSDHGFGSFRRGVDLNSWLFEQGLLALRDGRRPGREAGEFLRGVDWSKTKAYAVGLGGLYLNLRGRESQGIVDPGEAGALKSEIARTLRQLTDPLDGASPVRGVPMREELYHGPHSSDAPDLVVHFEKGYRVSWATSMGGVAAETIEDNTNAWSGDHIIDPALVPGVLAMNRPFDGGSARLLDLAPTILGALGVPKGSVMEGRSLTP